MEWLKDLYPPEYGHVMWAPTSRRRAVRNKGRIFNLIVKL